MSPNTHPSHVLSLVIATLAASLLAACSSVVILDNGSGGSSSSKTSSTGAGGTGAGGAVFAATTAVTSGSSLATSTGTDPPGPDEAVAFQINPGHSGSMENDSLTPPLTMRWTRDLGAQVSYPLIAGGRVFVTTGSDNSTAKLIALEQNTGNTG